MNKPNFSSKNNNWIEDSTQSGTQSVIDRGTEQCDDPAIRNTNIHIYSRQGQFEPHFTRQFVMDRHTSDDSSSDSSYSENANDINIDSFDRHSTENKGDVGACGYERLVPEEDAMASSIICTDGSDVEVLTDEPDSSDSIEVLAAVKKANRAKEQGNGNPTKDEDLGDVSSLEDATLTDGMQGTLGDLVMDTPDEAGVLMNEAAAYIEPIVMVKNQNEHAKPSTSSHTEGDDHSNLYSEHYADMDLMGDLEGVPNGSVSRPDSLSLPRPLQLYEKQRLMRKNSDSSSLSDHFSQSSSTEALIEAATLTPLHAQGTVTREGDMMSFVAEDLSEKIRISSPLTRVGDGSGSSWAGSQTPSGRSVSSFSSSTSGWSTSSASGWSALSNSGMSRPVYGNMLASIAAMSPSVMTQSPEDIPPIDPRVINELELHARRVAESLDYMMANMHVNLHKMSSITKSCTDVYKDSVDHTCDSVDACIKAMYTLMAKCEELSKTMKPIYKVADQIKEIKRLLDLFESILAREEK